MKRRVLTIALVVACLTMSAATAWAFWTALSVAGGYGAAAVTSVNQGATPTGSVTGNAVTLTWAPTTLTTGQAVSGYTVKRYSGSTAQTILTACTGTITSTGCVENNVPTGIWTYSVTPTFATNWVGVESAKSTNMVVGNVAPAAVADSYTVAEDAVLTVGASGVLGNDSDPNSDPLTAILASGVANGALTVNANGGFTYTPNPNFTGSDSFTYRANDGTNNSNLVTVTLTVTPVNDAPLNNVPGPQQTAKNANRVFSATTNNLISLSDADAGGATVQVQLTATNGTITLPVLTGLTFTGGDGTADATMTFTGTITNINLRLDGTTFIPTTGATGAAALQIVTSDLGSTGTGGPLTDSDTIAITINALGIFTANQDIGATGGSSTYSAGTYTVIGSGADIWGTADQFQYLYRDLTGDGRLTAKVVSSTQAPSDVGQAKAGVMLRESTAAGSKHAYMNIMKTSGSEFLWRTASDGATTADGTAGIIAPYWVRITRVGDTVTAQRSPDGVTWTTQGLPQTVAMTASIKVGLAVTAHDNTKLSTVTFDSVALTTPPTALADAYTTNEDTTLNVTAPGVLANDTDPESDALTAVLVSGTPGLTLNANGSFAYVPPADFSGVASFTYKTNDGAFASNIVTVNLTVNPANEVPSFTKGADQITPPSIAQTFAGWATAISQGAGESGQLVNFTVTNNNNAIFSLQPTVSPTGTLTYTASGTTGVATVSVSIRDNGGTANGGVDNSAIQTFTINVNALGIFTANQDIGAQPIAGSSAYSAGAYTMSGSGADIWGPPDQFQYLYRTMTGDGRLTARVVTDTASPTNGAAKAAVMIRNSLTTGSVHAMMGLTASNGTEFISRSVDQGTPYASSTGGRNNPYWIRITRIGNTLTGEVSSDGTAWVQQGTTQTITMGSTTYVGLVVMSHDNTASYSATFDNVAITVPSAPALIAGGGTTAHTENVPVVVDSAITVTDTDDANTASGTVTVGSGYTAGQDVLAFTNQNGITGSWSAPTMTLTGTATKAQWQTALRSITYNNTSDTPNTGNRTINYVVNDGSSNSNTAAKTVSVTATNDAPVNSVPGAQTTVMNTARVFSTGNANLISISDVDATTVQVQLVSTLGATTLFGTMPGSLTFTVGDGTADTTMTFSGTKAAVNAALDGLSFNPSGAGAASLQVLTSDLGATGTGGTLTDNDSVAITVTQDLGIFTANQDIGGPGSAGSSSHSAGTYTVAGGGADIWNNSDQFQFLSIPMTGDGRLTAKVVSQTQTSSTSIAAKAGVMFREALTAGSIHGMMDVMQANGSEFHWRLTTSGPSAATTGTGGIAAPYWVRITRVGNTVTGERSPDGITWTQQGAIQSIPMTSSIYAGLAVSAVDNAKLNTATFSNVTFEQPPVLAASGGTTAHTENVPVVVDSGITVTDVTSANLASGTVTVGSGYTAGQDVLAFTNQNGISGSWSAPTLTLTGSATKAQWQTALRSITYNNTSQTPNTGNRTINYLVNDASFTSNIAAKTVSVTAVNDAPVNSMPGAQTTSVNTAKVFSTGNGNLISITDVDAAGGTMQVQLVSSNGVTTLSGTAGLTITAGANGSANMTFTGSLAAVNTALAGLSFNPTTSFAGAASLQVVTADQGNTGSGGTLTDSDTVAITVTASAATLKAQYKSLDVSAPNDLWILPGLQLVNTGASDVDLSTITVRYWFTKDTGASSFDTVCNYAAIGNSNVNLSVLTVPSRAGADAYLLVGFQAYTLPAGASSGEMMLGFHKTDWTAFSEADDYSYGTGTSYADSTKVTVYQGGTLIWGTEP